MNDSPPIRPSLLPYGRQWIDDADVEAVVAALKSAWLTTGPAVERFESALCRHTAAAHAVAVSNGTAALHTAMAVLGVGPGDEVIVPAMTFAATANAVVYCGGTPVFADVEPDTLLLDPVDAASRITPRTRGIIAVDYAGQPADYAALRAVADRHGLFLAADACHALGGSLDGRSVGSLADVSTFSFHPVKPIATGEGGAVTTADEQLARRMRIFRNHGITSDHRSRESAGAHRYEMVSLGFNYRLSDIHCALGCSQLDKLPRWVARRQEIAAAYDASLAATRAYRPLSVRPGCSHAYHLYVVRCVRALIGQHRDDVFSRLRREGIGSNVHYPPVHLHPYYRERFATGPGMCPNAERAYEEILSLPIFPAMTDDDVGDVLRGLAQVAGVATGFPVIAPCATGGTSSTEPRQIVRARSA